MTQRTASNFPAPYNRMVDQSVNFCQLAQSNVENSKTQKNYWQYNPDAEIYSRKVFVGGLPLDIKEEEIYATFSRFGPVVAEWPSRTKNDFYPRGYVFLLFDKEPSVHALLEQCQKEQDKNYFYISSKTTKDKPVQVRAWHLADAEFMVDPMMPLDPRMTVFLGAVPRTVKSVELAHLMDRLYGPVCYAGIDTDPELKYPRGAARVSFMNQHSFIAAIAGQFIHIEENEMEKRVNTLEVKPYLMDNQMCDECQGSNCGGKYAPFFCSNVACLQYYCEHCWQAMHNHRARHNHQAMGNKLTRHSTNMTTLTTAKHKQYQQTVRSQTVASNLTSVPSLHCWWPEY